MEQLPDYSLLLSVTTDLHPHKLLAGIFHLQFSMDLKVEGMFLDPSTFSLHLEDNIYVSFASNITQK